MLQFSYYSLRFLIRRYSISTKVAPLRSLKPQNINSTKATLKCPINKPQNCNSTITTLTHPIIETQNINLTKTTLQYPRKEAQSTSLRKPIKSNVNKLQWTDQQLLVFAAIERKESVFVSGSAGTGKTKLIEEVIKLLGEIHGRRGVSVTAPTGVVACALGGQTLHSFAGIGLGEGDAHTLLSKVLANKMACRRWERARALVIDEISMVDGELFDKIEFIARTIRGKDEPWGGLQLVVSGDFLQLPPVKVGKSKKSESTKEFAFEASCWDQSFQFQVYLTTVFRQSDPELIRLLQGIRRGELDAEGLKLLEQRRCSGEPDETVMRLYPRIFDVDRVNNRRLKSLGEDIIVYEAFDQGEKPWIDQLDRGIASSQLQLCKGARVMLIKNYNVSKKLVNGSTGTIIGFKKAIKGNIVKICDDKWLPIVKFDCGYEKVMFPVKWDVMKGDKKCATRLQLPLILAWALSIHKSQGMTLDRLHTDVSGAFGCGMVYVALSRLRSLEGLSFSSDVDPSKILAHPKVLEFYENNFGGGCM